MPKFINSDDLNKLAKALNNKAKDAVSEESSRAQAAEKALQTSIDGKATSGHNHNTSYYTKSEINTKVTNLQAEIDADVKEEKDRAMEVEAELQAAIAGKAATGHNHDDRYFTESEITTKLAGKSDTSHTHDNRYYTETEIDSKVTTLNTAIATAKSDAQTYADNKIAALVDSAPDAMNTLNELASAISDHQDVYDAYVESVTASLAGKSDTDHTHNYAGSSSAGGAAKSADKVNKNLTIKLNSGTSEGTNLFTFNGSAVKTIDITPSTIGAATESHGTHVTWSTTTPKANGTAAIGSETKVARGDHVHPLQTSVSGNAGTATKLKTAKTIQIGNKSNSFDGSENITYTLADIGAAASSHTHKYAGSSSAGGAADSVKTNLVIKLNGGATEGTNLFTFNGSTAKTVNITPDSIGAAASSHGTHVTYSTTAPKVAGTAAVGNETTVARGDHVHPAQASVTGNAGTATKLATAKTITIGNKGKSFDGSANISYSLDEIGASPLQKSVVSKSKSGTTLTLSTDRYQKATLASGDTIALPNVSNFTEINLFVKDCSLTNVILPDNCKWRVDPNLQTGTSFIFTFIYTTQEWLAEVKIYS